MPRGKALLGVALVALLLGTGVAQAADSAGVAHPPVPGVKPQRPATVEASSAAAAAVALPVAVPTPAPSSAPPSTLARASLSVPPDAIAAKPEHDAPAPLSMADLSAVAPHVISTASGRVSASASSFATGELPPPVATPAPGDAASGRVRPLAGNAFQRLFAADAKSALLGAEDANRYRRAMEAARRGDKPGMDIALDGVSDRRLVGYVQALRLLHPATVAGGEELAAWMKAYGDQPQASRLYKLAVKRAGGGVAAPRGRGDGPDGRAFREEVGGGTDDFLRASGGFGPAELYYKQGNYSAALEQAAAAADGNGKQVPTALWIAGLSAWRLDRLEASAKYFNRLAAHPRTGDWDKAAGAFWAGRAYLRLGRAAEAEKAMLQATQQPRTFYGLLATRALGLDLPLDWSVPQMTARHAGAIAAAPALSRATALLQLGEAEAAEAELSAFEPGEDRYRAEAVQTLVDAGGMARIAWSISGGLPGAAKQRLALGWPVPWWQPAEGWKVDPSIVLALARVESKYNPSARGGSGAIGLMQLMPATARAMERRLGAVNKGSGSFTDPHYNLSLGQRYIQYLLQDGDINGNLLYMVVAYNGGPGNLQKWRARAKAEHDPLLFVESIPSRETRNFVEQVLTNNWLYVDRLHQSTPDLDMLAQGKWPIYRDGRMQLAKR